MPPNTGPDLAGAITARRIELGLSQSEAARRAGVSRPAWIAWENDTRPQDQNYATIERTLEWERGSITAVLAGREPVARQGERTPPAPPPRISPADWARWDPLDQEMILNALRVARARLARNHPDEGRHQRGA
jgi:transcriptional regulator with XRE-family HTH domain